MMGKIIVIEGLDGSGKSTQLELLKQKLSEQNTPFKYIKFPDYENPSSTLVRMYLAGDFGDKPSDVNAYAASSFYAVDRYANYKTNFKEFYDNGGVILCDRYTTSNAVHQASKLSSDEIDDYLDWLYDFEFNKLKIPAPDVVIYLDMPIEISQKLMTGRYSGDEEKKDIHEKDVDYLHHCRTAAVYAAKKLGWNVISCAQGDAPRSRESISQEIYQIVKKEVL